MKIMVYIITLMLGLITFTYVFQETMPHFHTEPCSEYKDQSLAYTPARCFSDFTPNKSIN